MLSSVVLGRGQPVTHSLSNISWVVEVSIINILKGNHCILRIQGALVPRNLGMNLENKVVQKLKLEKKFFYKKWSPKLIFLNDFFFEKIPSIFDIEN